MNSRKHTLSRDIILKKRSDISRVLKSGSRIPGKVFNTFIYNSGNNRVAFLINKRVGNAVKRNRMKRLVREVFRLKKEKFEGKEVVFNIKLFWDDFLYLLSEMENIKEI